MVLAVLLQGCATLGSDATITEKITSQIGIQNFTLSGRVGVQYEKEGYSAGLRWRHQGNNDELLLSNPLGQGVAKIVGNEQGISLTTANGEEFRATDAEGLTEQVLGWRLPLRGLRYWVLGLPSPDAAHQIEKNEQHITRLYQQGWQIDYSSFQTEAGTFLPTRMRMKKQGLDIKLIIDSWEV